MATRYSCAGVEAFSAAKMSKPEGTDAAVGGQARRSYIL